MTDLLFLVKYGEIALKKRNRGAFIKSLKDSIRAKLPGLQFAVYETFHRVFVRFPPEHEEAIAAALARTFGVVSFCKALQIDRDISAIESAAAGLAEGFIASGMGKKFKVETRRADKAFPLTSYEISCRVGELLLDQLRRRQRPAEHHSLHRVVARRVPAEFGRAERTPGDAVARVVQTGKRST